MCMCEVRQVFERWYRKIDKILRWKNDGAQWSQKKPKINAILCAKRIHDRFQFTDPFRKKRSAFSIYDNFISCVIYLSFLIISKLLHSNSVHHSTLPCQKLFTKNCRVYIYDIYSPRSLNRQPWNFSARWKSLSQTLDPSNNITTQVSQVHENTWIARISDERE